MPATTAAKTGRAQPYPDPPRRAPVQQPAASLELTADLALCRVARVWGREVLHEWHLAGLADDAETPIGEMVDNAVDASADLDQPAICLALVLEHGELAILARDGNQDPPLAQHPAGDAESGRGLLMVGALSDRFGWYPLVDGAGKVVWAVLPVFQMHPATSPLASTPQAPAWPENAQPDRWRGPLTEADHAGRTVAERTRPLQHRATSARASAAEARSEDANGHPSSRSLPPAAPRDAE
jgi:anti-sigma regulatory factor (Ser/Thr protein kinase)